MNKTVSTYLPTEGNYDHDDLRWLRSCVQSLDAALVEHINAPEPDGPTRAMREAFLGVWFGLEWPDLIGEPEDSIARIRKDFDNAYRAMKEAE